MTKVIRDGCVGVLYSPGFGAGWYSWHRVEELIFDPNVIAIVEKYQNEYEDRQSMALEIEAYCTKTYGDEYYYGGADDLVVEWLPVETKFWINEYDGSESLITIDSMDWITA